VLVWLQSSFKISFFGHKKGAFTGAIADKKGLVEIANGGDLFLDEIGEMSLEAQAHFLTFLDSREYYRLGDDKKKTADLRIICATNRDLKAMVAEGTFRKDLYSRIAQVVVPIPPLRDRMSDIPLLFEHFVAEFTGSKKSYDPAILKLLENYQWEEGNVREFRDAIEYLCIMSRDSDRLELEHLSEKYRPLSKQPAIQKQVDSISLENMTAVFEFGLETYLGHLEKKILESSIKNYGGNLESMAEELKISRPTLYRRLKKYEITKATLA